MRPMSLSATIVAMVLLSSCEKTTVKCIEGATRCGDECVDLQSDPSNCGECGTSCGTDERCSAGTCEACGADAPTLCGGDCVDTQRDSDHCGACGTACASGEICVDGTCGPNTCGGSTPTACGDACVDLMTNDDHCGECDSACSPGEECVDGVCLLLCGSSAPRRCGDECVDWNTDRAHCGACDSACADGEACIDGSCAEYCGSGLLECGGVCIDPDTNPDHCGDCGSACADDRECEGGTCVCGGTLTECGGACVDTQTSTSHCGGCAGAGGEACTDPADGTALCIDGSCTVFCDPGFIWEGSACRTLYPATCAEQLATFPTTTDGSVLLYAGNDPASPWRAYCHDMAGTPIEYLELSVIGTSYNYGQYTAGGYSPGTNVRTSYTALRIDPSTFVVDITDQRFSSSTGSLLHGSTTVTSMNYTVAQSCDGTDSGRANIDLRGTGFRVIDTFCLGGYGPSGGATFSYGDQVVNLTGGGSCGAIMACPFTGTGAQLDLEYITP